MCVFVVGTHVRSWTLMRWTSDGLSDGPVPNGARMQRYAQGSVSREVVGVAV